MGRGQGEAAHRRLDREEWSRFWGRGTLTTFEGHFRNNYDAEIRDFWWAEFERLPPGAVIVDLATGNGALAVLAARFARERERRFSITGLDHATIDKEVLRAARPELAAELDAIELKGGVPLESTGLAETSVDLLTSQYGFEYGDTAAGAREAARILRPGGRIAMVLHHHDSAILAQAREGLAQVALALEDVRLTYLARRMIKLYRGLKPGDGPGGVRWSPGAVKLREELLAAAERLAQHARSPEARARDAGFIEFLLPTVMGLVEQCRNLDPVALETGWLRIDAEVDAYRLRMEDLAAAALDSAGVARIRAELADAGFVDLDDGPLSYQGGLLMGWRLTARRP